MSHELSYFLKINVAIALFYAFYRLFFYRDTFFQWRRTALLCFFIVSLSYPLLNIQEWIKEQEPMIAMVDLYSTMISSEPITGIDTVVTPGTNWKAISISSLTYIYISIAALLFLRFFIQLFSLIRLGLRTPTTTLQHMHVHVLPRVQGPFSFFKWIFIHPDAHSQDEIEEILTHENTHARQWHSIDVLCSELMCILCWFNPFVWLMKREVRNNLEFMADHKVLENGYDCKTYQYHLLGLAHQKSAATLSNSFNILPLKIRIRMMNKKRTRDIGRAKYLVFLPLAAILLIISNIGAIARSTERFIDQALQLDAPEIKETEGTAQLPIEADSDVYGSSIVSQATTVSPIAPVAKQPNAETTQVNELSEAEEVIFEIVEQMPEFPGGQWVLMQYLSQHIKYPTAAQQNGIQGRVIVQFVVNTEGKISNPTVARSVSPELDAEALRVISQMPNWQPGRQRGKAVSVKYTVPVMFRLAFEENTRPTKEENTEMYSAVNESPEYPGGIEALQEYIRQNVRYPVIAQEENAQGRVIVEFIVDKEGSLLQPQVIKSVHPALDEEAIRVIKGMGKWHPGKNNGEHVAVKYSLPIIFTLA